MSLIGPNTTSDWNTHVLRLGKRCTYIALYLRRKKTESESAVFDTVFEIRTEVLQYIYIYIYDNNLQYVNEMNSKYVNNNKHIYTRANQKCFPYELFNIYSWSICHLLWPSIVLDIHSWNVYYCCRHWNTRDHVLFPYNKQKHNVMQKN